METSRGASRRKVSEAFLHLENDKGDPLVAELISRRFSNDDDFFRQYRSYADVCKIEKRESPVLVWTVGVSGDDSYEKVDKWYLTKINLNELYSCAMGQDIQSDLDTVQGNLKDFAALVKNDPCRYPEFNLACFPEDEEKQTVIGVAHSTCDRQGNIRKGSIELIDGARRTVSMLANGLTHAPAYIAIVTIVKR